MDHHRPVELFGQNRFIASAEIIPVLKIHTLLVQNLRSFIVRDSGKRRDDSFQRCCIPIQALQLFLPILQHPLDDERNEIFRQDHAVVQVRVSHLGLDHPELRQMPACFRLLGPERRPETVNLAEGSDSSFVVELPALRQVSFSPEVIRLEERRSSLAGIGREDGRIQERESASVEKIAAGLDDLMSNFQNRPLMRRTEPEMAMIHQESCAVLLGRDGIILSDLMNLDVLDLKFVPARRALVRRYHPRHRQRGLLRHILTGLKRLLRHIRLRNHTLDYPRPIPYDEKPHFPARTLVVEPSPDSDFLTFISSYIGNICLFHCPSLLSELK